MTPTPTKKTMKPNPNTTQGKEKGFVRKELINTKIILKALSKAHGRNVIYFTRLGEDGGSKIYYSDIEIFNGPMWLFHLLRKIAIGFDKMAGLIRKIIGKLTTNLP